MSFSLQVLCSTSVDSTACTVVTTESHRIIIDCGEGIQRLCVEHKIRLGKISAIMFTEFSPQACLGLPGLSLTVADAGNTNITVSGPSQLKALLDSTRHFMKLPDGLLRLVQHDSCDQTSSSGPHVVFQNSEVLLQQITFKAPTDSLESTSTELTSRCCYIGNTPELQGKFDIKRAEAFNVPKGPLFGKLKKGETITLADGTVIKPEQVLGESEPSRYFAVVCRIAPEETALLHEVTNNCHLNRHFEAPAGSGDMLCMVHLSPAATIQSPTYQSWMQRFGPHVTHLLSGAGCSSESHTAFAATTTHSKKMHLAAPALFPCLRHIYTDLHPHMRTLAETFPSDGTLDEASATAAELAPVVCANPKVVPGIPGMKYHFLPLRNKGLEQACEVDCTLQASVLWEDALGGLEGEEIKKALVGAAAVQACANSYSTDTASATAAATAALDNKGPSSTSVRDLYGLDSQRAHLLRTTEGSISFLGTGCAIPSKYRNVSGVLLDLPRGALLIDAGEGTWAQMLRMQYETMSRPTAPTPSSPSLIQVSAAVAQKLKVVWVSHPHADHHLGLVRVIVERKAALLALSQVQAAQAHAEKGGVPTDTEVSAGAAQRPLKPPTSCCPEIFNMLDSMLCDAADNTGGDTVPSADPKKAFEPLIVIAPPSVLAFLVEYAVLDNSIADAYIGVSCRSYDPNDDCLYTDAFWNDRKHGAASKEPFISDVAVLGHGGLDSGEVGDRREIQALHEFKRQRVATAPDEFFSSMLSAPDTISTADSAAATVSEESAASTVSTLSWEKNHPARPLKPAGGKDKTRRTGMAATSAVPATAEGVAGGRCDLLSGGGRAWRNFTAVFREEVSSVVRERAAAARHQADTVLKSIGVESLLNVQVVHCGQSFGLCIELSEQVSEQIPDQAASQTSNSCHLAGSGSSSFMTSAWEVDRGSEMATAMDGTSAVRMKMKIVYSGDTRPCERLVEVGCGATVLIHEATFEDDKAEEALLKRHSTMGEAAQVGRDMGAFRVIFTHFSQRYPGVPLLNAPVKSPAVLMPVLTNGVMPELVPELEEVMEMVTEEVVAVEGAVASAMEVEKTEQNCVPDQDQAVLMQTDSNKQPQQTAVPQPILAFDFMHLRFADLLWAPAVTAVFERAFGGARNGSANSNFNNDAAAEN